MLRFHQCDKDMGVTLGLLSMMWMEELIEQCDVAEMCHCDPYRECCFWAQHLTIVGKNQSNQTCSMGEFIRYK